MAPSGPFSEGDDYLPAAGVPLCTPLGLACWSSSVTSIGLSSLSEMVTAPYYWPGWEV